MLVSTRRSIQYPNPTRADVPDIPAHFVNLINALDLDMPFSSGTLAARPAAPTYAGQCYWATDTQLLYLWNGTVWVTEAGTASPAFSGTPTAPTPASTDNSQQIATTAFVRTILPPGVMMAYVGAVAPAGWLLCDGTAVSRTGANAALFAIIGTVYGAGDGSTTFNLPDMRGRVPVGKNAATFSTLGSTGGEETHLLTSTEMPSHTHTESAVSAGTPAGSVSSSFSGNTLPGHDHFSIGTEGGSPMPNQVFRYGIGVFGAGGLNGITDIGGWMGSSNGANLPNALKTTSDSAGTPSGSVSSSFSGSALGGHAHTINNTGGGAVHNNIQPYQVVNYIVKQ